MAYAAAHPVLLTCVLVALSWLLLRGGRALIRFPFERPVALWVVTLSTVAIWTVATESWRSVNWSAVLYFVCLGVVTYTGLAILWHVYKTLKRRTDDHR